LTLSTLSLGTLLHLFVNVINTEPVLTHGKPSDPKPLSARIHEIRKMMIHICIDILSLVIKMDQADKLELIIRIHMEGAHTTTCPQQRHLP
jgi:hypothetical protein